MKINRLLTNICSTDLTSSKSFYTSLFDLQVGFESDWFIHLISKDKKLELGIIDRNNEMVPAESRKAPQGIYLTMVVDDVDQIFIAARKAELDIIEEPTNTFYGQRRMLLCDPDGMIVDVSSPIV